MCAVSCFCFLLLFFNFQNERHVAVGKTKEESNNALKYRLTDLYMYACMSKVVRVYMYLGAIEYICISSLFFSHLRNVN